jgi:transposase-like protein
MPKPFPEEFRRDVVAVARKGEAPLTQVAKDFGISQSCLKNWLKRADIEEGPAWRHPGRVYRAARGPQTDPATRTGSRGHASGGRLPVARCQPQ